MKMCPATMKAPRTWTIARWPRRSAILPRCRYWCKNTITITNNSNSVTITISNIKTATLCWPERRAAAAGRSGAEGRRSRTHNWRSLNASSARKSICPLPIAVTWPKR